MLKINTCVKYLSNIVSGFSQPVGHIEPTAYVSYTQQKMVNDTKMRGSPCNDVIPIFIMSFFILMHS